MAPPQHCRPPPLDEPAAALEEEEEWQGGRRSREKSASTHPAIKFPRKTPPTTAPPPPPSPAPHHRDKSQWESLWRISSSSAPQKPTHGNFVPLPQNSSLQKSNLATNILFSSASCDSSNRPPKTSLQSKIFKGCPKKA